MWVIIDKILPNDKGVLKRISAYYGLPIERINDKEKIDFIYMILSVLDSKASSLMQFNGIIIAILAFLKNPLFFIGHSITSYLSLAFSILSIIICLPIISVAWNFMGKAVSKYGNIDPEKEIDSLCKIMVFRERSYQVAWLFSSLSVLFMGMFLFWQL